MRKLLISFLFFVIIFSNIAYATQIETHDITLDLDNLGVAHINVDLKYRELTTDKISYLVFTQISKLEAKDSKGTMECILQEQTYGTQILCKPNTQNLANYSINLKFDAFGLTSKSAKAHLFRYDYGIKEPTASFTVGLILPEGTGLVEPTEEFKPYFPKDAEIGSKFGRRVTLKWKVDSPELGKTYTVTATFEELGGFFNYNYLYFVLLAIVILLVYFWWSRRTTKAKTVLSVLKDAEKKAVEIIIEKGDNCKQRDIVRGTNFSKAKVSRIVADLAERGIIKKKVMGRTNKIILIAKGLKKQPEK